MAHPTAVFYCGHPDIHPSVPSGYATHINGVIGGLEANGMQTVMCLAGHKAAPRSERATPAIGPTKSRLRQAMPTYAWNALRDARLASFDRRAARTLDEMLQGRTTSLVYERFTHLHSRGTRVAGRRNVDHVLEVNAPPTERADLGGSSPFDALAAARARSAILGTTVGVFVSTALKSAYQGLCDDALDHTIVVPNGIDPTMLDLNRSIGCLATKRTVRIGFTGSLFDWHGLDLLLLAFAPIARDYQDVELVIVGDGPAMPALRSLSAELGVGDMVTFTGAVSHDAAIEWTKRFDIAVMANSNWYGSPTKLVEYAATGKAIIAPSTTPVEEVFTHELNALISRPSAPEIEAALRRLINEPDLRARLGEAARRMALSSLTWETLVKGVLLKLEEADS